VELAVAGTDYVLMNWTSPDDVIRWRFRLLEPEPFELQIQYVSQAKSAGGQIEFQVQDQKATFPIRTAVKPGDPVADAAPLTISSGGEQVLTLRGIEKQGDEFCILQSVRIVPLSEVQRNRQTGSESPPR
jgi:hypothetical protein